MNKNTTQISLAALSVLFSTSAFTASVNTGDRLTINSGVYSYTSSGYISGVTSGSWFGCDCNNNSAISGTEQTALHQGTEGIIIGVVQGTGTPTHSGSPYATDWNRITAPYTFFNNTAQEYTTSPITGSTEAGLNFSGFNWPWNGIESIDFGSGAWGAGYTNGIANFTWDGVYGHSYTIDYRLTIPLGDPSGIGGVQFAYHFEGTVEAVPVPAAVWLFGSGLLGLFSVVRKKSQRQL